MQLARKILVLLFVALPARAKDPQPSVPTLRWRDRAPQCTLQRSEDGHTYYGISTEQLEITVAVDNQELEKVRHRTVPMIGVLLSLSYKGLEPLAIAPSQATLEFVKHFHVVQRALDPDTMLKQLQQNMDDLTDEITRHELKKHPELKEAKEAELQQRLKDYTDMMDFISTHSLRNGVLNSSDATKSGWVFFSINNRWIGPWRRPEQFVLRIPIKNSIVEFPFELPPKGGKVELRRRE